MLPINQQQLAPRSIFNQNKQATSISIMLVLVKMDMTKWTSLANQSRTICLSCCFMFV
jgi:hypothetical protein